MDPRTTALFALAERTGFHGRYVALMQALSAQAEKALGKPGVLPVNATGALAALASELGIAWQLCRGIAVIGRAVGLVGHIAEELRNPIAERLWVRTDAEVSAHLKPAPQEPRP
ncbi:citrate synthase [Bordetella pertussis]|nr:citrate synthase [Bordetella pertussis]